MDLNGSSDEDEVDVLDVQRMHAIEDATTIAVPLTALPFDALRAVLMWMPGTCALTFRACNKACAAALSGPWASLWVQCIAPPPRTRLGRTARSPSPSPPSQHPWVFNIPDQLLRPLIENGWCATEELTLNGSASQGALRIAGPRLRRLWLDVHAFSTFEALCSSAFLTSLTELHLGHHLACSNRDRFTVLLSQILRGATALGALTLPPTIVSKARLCELGSAVAERSRLAAAPIARLSFDNERQSAPSEDQTVGCCSFFSHILLTFPQVVTLDMGKVHFVGRFRKNFESVSHLHSLRMQIRCGDAHAIAVMLRHTEHLTRLDVQCTSRMGRIGPGFAELPPSLDTLIVEGGQLTSDERDDLAARVANFQWSA